MFRKMRRFKQELSKEECMEILKNEPRGVLSVLGDDGYPYGMPVTHWYNEKNGKIYFHGAKSGHKIDATNMCDKFTDDKEYAKVELSKCGSSVLCLELNPEHITGKLVNES